MAIKISGTTIIDDSRTIDNANLQSYKEKIVTRHDRADPTWHTSL